MRYLLIWCIALGLAGFSAIASLSAATRSKLPEFSVSLWPANGFALAQLADNATKDAAVQASTASKGAPTGLQKIQPMAAENGARAFALEPTSVTAIRTLALQKQADGQAVEARRLMRRANLLNKRDIIVNFWLIDDYSRGGDVANTLRIYDETLRTVSYERKGKLLTIMANALADETFVEPYFLLLEKRPPWADAFWRQAAQTAPSVMNAGKLRIRVGRRGIHPSDEVEQLLLTSLADQKRFDDAWQIDRLKSGQKAPVEGVRNGSFDQEPGLPPFDWRFISSGDLGAGINQEAGSLEVSVVPGGKGLVAQQLVRLSPGRYSLNAVIRAGEASSVGQHVEIRCAEKAGRVVKLDLAGNRARDVDLTGGSCRYYWLDLNVSAIDGAGGGDLVIDSLSLKKRT